MTASDALRWNRTMSIRPLIWLAAVLAVVGLANTASAQRFQPFIDPGYFEPDFQFFAPAEVGDFGGGDPPNTGVYFDYDRTYVAMSRPDGEDSLFSGFDGDFTWGNRWELGYMTEEQTGWQGVLWHLSGPNVYVSNIVERINRINEDDLPVNDEPDPIIADRNPRIYDVRQSLNVASMSSFEFNKTWRRKQFHNGSVLEPLAGFRYMNYRNFKRRTDYDRFAEDINGQPDPFTPDVEGPYEQFTEDFSVFENFMIGGQLGGRWFQQRGKWLLSADVRFFAMHNFQYLKNRTDITLTRYDGPLGDTVDLELNERFQSHDNANQFVWGGEVRAEAAYSLTRDISLQFGMVFLDLGQGIGRSDNVNDNNEDVQIAGLTFGVTVNR
jgi:hypothetical protein